MNVAIEVAARDTLASNADVLVDSVIHIQAIS